MALVVVDYASISEHDYSWIQTIRAEHDMYYEIVAPHFTFVFPCSITDQAWFIGYNDIQVVRR
jgi:hypothetical protein